jgi:acetolactate synthase-1/2/3 large subunit
VGVTGFLGHASVFAYMQRHRPARVLVLGSRLGEATSSWDPRMVPSKGFVHVDLDPTVPGRAYPDAPCLAVEAEVRRFVSLVLERLPERRREAATEALPRPEIVAVAPQARGPVRPVALMQEIQRAVVDGSDAPVLADAGNSAAWMSHYLRFSKPGRFRLSTGFGSMGHAASGVLGAAVARRGKAVAVVGDGAMLMSNEVSTAVACGAAAVWIVLNDARYGMIEQGLARLGMRGLKADIPRVDFVALARAIGADGVRVEREGELGSALAAAMGATTPFVVDVVIDQSEAPFMGRVKTLLAQGVGGQMA